MSDLRSLFDDHSRLRAVIDAVIEGRQGRAEVTVDGEVALLHLGCYAVPGGDPESPSTTALLGRVTAPIEIVLPRDPRWRERIVAHLGANVTDRPMQAFLPSPRLDSERLRGMLADLAEGYRLAPLDAALAVRFGAELSPNGIDVFGGPEDFARDGFGVVALRGAEPVCAASSYALSSGDCEVAIATHPEHRGRGLATAVSAAMLLECETRCVTPHWNAANPVSQRLARRLGFENVGVCEILGYER